MAPECKLAHIARGFRLGVVGITTINALYKSNKQLSYDQMLTIACITQGLRQGALGATFKNASFLESQGGSRPDLARISQENCISPQFSTCRDGGSRVLHADLGRISPLSKHVRDPHRSLNIILLKARCIAQVSQRDTAEAELLDF